MFSYLRDKLTGDDEDTTQEDDDTEASDEEDHGETEEDGFLAKATNTVLNTTIDDESFNDLFWELERILLTNNVAKPVVDELKEKLRDDLVGKDVRRGTSDEQVASALREAIRTVLLEPDTAFIELTARNEPLKVLVIGVNGSGKTTTVAKLAKHAQDKGKSVVLGASDTYRAAAIQQLEEHANNLGAKLIKHEYGADPAAVAYDTVQHAEASGKDVSLIDTAGRLHNDDNLMQQLEKIHRVVEPDLTLFVAESVTGNDAVRQIQQFQDVLPVDGVIMTKVDADDKGGAVLSVSHVTGAPIYFLGTGQSYDDLERFDKDDVMEKLGL